MQLNQSAALHFNHTACLFIQLVQSKHTDQLIIDLCCTFSDSFLPEEIYLHIRKKKKIEKKGAQWIETVSELPVVEKFHVSDHHNHMGFELTAAAWKSRA